MFEWEQFPVVKSLNTVYYYGTPDYVGQQINAKLAEGYYIKHQSIAITGAGTYKEERMMVTMEKLVREG